MNMNIRHSFFILETSLRHQRPFISDRTTLTSSIMTLNMVFGSCTDIHKLSGPYDYFVKRDYEKQCTSFLYRSWLFMEGFWALVSILTSCVEVLYDGLLYVRLLTPGSANFNFLCLKNQPRMSDRLSEMINKRLR